MAGSSASEYFEIPKFFFFKEKGIFSGSREDRDFNYKVKPDCPKEGEKLLKAYYWSGRNCIDKSENVTEKAFPLSQEGYDDMLKWLEEQCMSCPQVKTASDLRQERVREILHGAL